MIQKVEFTNDPPTFDDIPKLEMELFARDLARATLQWKLEMKAKAEGQTEANQQREQSFPQAKAKANKATEESLKKKKALEDIRNQIASLQFLLERVRGDEDTGGTVDSLGSALSLLTEVSGRIEEVQG